MSCNDNGFDNLPHNTITVIFSHYECVLACTYCSLNAVVAQPKNCTFGIVLQWSLKNITTTSNNNGV